VEEEFGLRFEPPMVEPDPLDDLPCQ
jgi:hypothetical protein